MNDTQCEAMAVLREVWELSPPDVRLGQLMAHLGFLGDVLQGKGLGYIEDDELLEVLYHHRDELTARLEGAEEHSLQGAGAESPGAPETSKE